MKENIRLRKLEIKDSENMLEWMMDPTIYKNFRFSRDNITIEKTREFIIKANEDIGKTELHLAIADSENQYMGTISLKHIDKNVRMAEYAIALRKTAQNRGIAKEATNQILKIAFMEMDLNRVYLNVLSENKEAIRTYEKVGFIYEGEMRQHILINEEIKSLAWYGMLKTDYLKNIQNNYN